VSGTGILPVTKDTGKMPVPHDMLSSNLNDQLALRHPSFSPEPKATAWLFATWQPAFCRWPCKRRRRWFWVKQMLTAMRH